MIRRTSRHIGILFVVGLSLVASTLAARTNVVVERNRFRRATDSHSFRVLESPAAEDLAAKAEFSLVAGRRDRNGGELDVLHDGKGAGGSDRPRDNFFLAASTSGGRILVDLRSPQAVDRVNTYSWHTGGRAPQVYSLWASAGAVDGFDPRPGADVDLAKAGWTKVADVDTRPESGESGGQYAVSVFDSDGAIGPFRYLLLDVSATDASDPFGNTFFSEIDVVAGTAPVTPSADSRASYEMKGGAYRFTIDTSGSADLGEWARKDLAPVVLGWYPKIVELLPSEGYVAPDRFSITISDNIGGVAATGGSRVRCNGNWMRRNIEGEAKGAVVHELVHVVQRYRRRRGGSRPPGWLVEGIADYIRWFLYEPESRGAEIRRRSIDRARHDAGYRVSANFLDWVTREKDKTIVRKLNAALRKGEYAESIWKDATGSTLDQLAAAWKANLRKRLEDPAKEPAEDSAKDPTEDPTEDSAEDSAEDSRGG